jgi:hypothetical protein
MAKSRKRFIAFLPIAVLLGKVSGSAQPAIIEQLGTIETKPPAGHGPTASEWSALANLPDWTGVWTPEWDIVQGVCLEGNFVDQVDTNGYAIFVPIKPDAK